MGVHENMSQHKMMRYALYKKEMVILTRSMTLCLKTLKLKLSLFV